MADGQGVHSQFPERFISGAYFGTQLLQSPAFHRSVHELRRRVRWMTHGKSPEEMGGTNIDSILPAWEYT